ncbi:lysophospholipid acyltransferase family protein [Kiritimatiellota bacterium B12222]|nr:lysophospholipid acyltransferase family protein [Kiritimatiellota bacterium B12222]
MTFKHYIEFIFLWICQWIIKHLPKKWAYACLETLTWWIHQGLGWRNKETQTRMADIFSEKSTEELFALRKEALHNFGRNLCELIRMGKDSEVEIEGKEETFEAFRKAREKKKGILLVIAHSGNWDLAGVQTVKEGFPMCFIARQQKNTLTYDLLLKVREEGGGTVIDRDDPQLIKKLLTFLADNGIVAILVDIRARQAGDQYAFLGKEGWIANGLGLLAAKSEAEVVPVFLGRKGRSTHIWKPKAARRLAPGSKSKQDRKHLLQSCLDDLSSEILQNPESYFWYNKRWVLEQFDEEVTKEAPKSQS